MFASRNETTSVAGTGLGRGFGELSKGNPQAVVVASVVGKTKMGDDEPARRFTEVSVGLKLIRNEIRKHCRCRYGYERYGPDVTGARGRVLAFEV